jgi:predicted metal-binding membrane protein
MTLKIPFETVLRRERFIVASGLVLISVMAWVYMVYLAWEMPAMDQAMAMPQWKPWGLTGFLLTFIMWAVMMMAMMVPSAAPLILMFASVYRKREQKDGVFVPTWIFLAGYIAVWSGFSLLAALAQWGLHEATLLSPMMVATSPLLGGTLLIAAGVFQWAPLKEACLARCRTPLGFLMTEWRDGAWGALVMGLRHGAFCTGCCWALMALLFVGGVMNLLWVAAIALFVFTEKLAPHGDWIARFTGVLLFAYGGWLMWTGMS